MQNGIPLMSVTIHFLDSLWERCVGQLRAYLEGNAIFFSLEQEEPQTPVNAGPSSNEDPSSSSSTQNSVAPGKRWCLWVKSQFLYAECMRKVIVAALIIGCDRAIQTVKFVEKTNIR